MMRQFHRAGERRSSTTRVSARTWSAPARASARRWSRS
jgi:hypothetical protein